MTYLPRMQSNLTTIKWIGNTILISLICHKAPIRCLAFFYYCKSYRQTNPIRIKLRSSMSSVQSAAAGHMRQNSSAHVVCSRAAIWTLISFKWSQLYLLLICLIWRTCITCQASWMTRSFLNLSKEECEYLIMMHIPYTPLSETRNPWPLCNFIENCLFSMMTNTWLMKRKC